MVSASTVQWSGLGFAPYSLPDLPSFLSDRGGSFVTEWETSVCYEERRAGPRQVITCELLMTDPTWCETENPMPIRGVCLNVSDEGLHAVLPTDYGISVGQRYLFQLHPFDSELGSQPQIGLIVRSELLVREGADVMAIGVKLLGSVHQ